VRHELVDKLYVRHVFYFLHLLSPWLKT